MTLYMGVPAEPPREPDQVSFVTVHIKGEERVGIRMGTHVWLVPPDRPPAWPWFMAPLIVFCLVALATGFYLAATTPDNRPAPAVAAEAPLHPAPIAPSGPGKDWRRGDH